MSCIRSHESIELRIRRQWFGTESGLKFNYAYYGWRSRRRAEDGYSLNRLGSDAVIAGAEAAGLRLVTHRNYSLTVPVLSRLPDRLLLRLERRFLNSRLSRHGGESLLLFQRVD